MQFPTVRLLITGILLTLAMACSSLDDWTLDSLSTPEHPPSPDLESSRNAVREHLILTAETHGLDVGTAFQSVAEDIAATVQHGKEIGWIGNESEAVMVETGLLLSYYIGIVVRGDWRADYVSSELHRLAALQDGAIHSIAITNSAGIVHWSAPGKRNLRGLNIQSQYDDLLKDRLPMMVEPVGSNATQRVGVAGVDRPRIVLVEFRVLP